jgi:hypothetical protein
MARFTVKALLGALALASVVCAVIFAFPPYVRIATLFIGVLVLPGPLIAAVRYGTAWARTFAQSALVSYGAWFVVVGIPAGWHATNELDLHGVPLAVLATEPSSSGIIGQPGVSYAISFYLLYAVLYAPWFIVTIGGALGLVVYMFKPNVRPAHRETSSETEARPFHRTI